ncbi:hypothetical protein GCM10023193_81570 [Planotetraspora kaengkrachanensis]|uniref:histidine kinase n=1 Tax=Planotetraspora kaengkrachanensis TaxID=575193 RepID=A0A8J3Q1A1_9ACTN|nr:hypothetical protein Pka01_80290 [Planotetraspora kaengkrachanensis]
MARHLRPQSIRGRLTVLVTLLAILLLLPTGAAEGAVGRQALGDALWLEAREQANLTAAADRLNELRDPLVPRVAGVDLVQVVAPGHRVVDASRDALGMPPLTSAWPAPGDPEEDVQTCTTHLGCVRLAALRIKGTANSPVVYAGRLAAGLTSTGIFARLFGVQDGLLVLLAALATWKITGRTLKPVNAIRDDLDAINGDDPSARVPELPGRDEIARLARTVNATLGRIEEATLQRDAVLARQRQFVADASHELRTPLAGLRAELEMGQLHPEDTDLNELVDGALGDVDRLEAIITDLLLLARVGTAGVADRTPMNLCDLVQAEVSQRLDRLPVRVRTGSSVPVTCVRVQIARLLRNLLDNAQRHSRSLIQVGVRRDGPFAELTVDDDGPGIPEPDRERVFERFTRLDTARSRGHGGTGLGLAIALEIARAHRGTLEAGESPSGGARFLLRLPLDGSLGYDGDHLT